MGSDDPRIGKNVRLCPDGAYRWVYEFNLWRNPTILITVLKIFGGILAVGAVLMSASIAHDMALGYAHAGDLLDAARSMGLFFLFFAALTLAGYAVYAVMQGGVYCVLFTMDEKGVLHKQLPKQYKKAQVVSALNVLAGVAAGNATLAGIGLTSARDSTSSDFSAVRSVKGSRLLRVIKVNEPLAKNQVYVEPEDYDFVFGYIRDHCPDAKVKG